MGTISPLTFVTLTVIRNFTRLILSKVIDPFEQGLDVFHVILL